ncbi:MAG: 5-formyltetrahydrofolate cyclo-ligase [Pseudomonadota bacterium]
MSLCKPDLRKVAFEVRKTAHASVDPSSALAALLAEVVRMDPGRVAGYLPIRTELDPRPVLHQLHARGMPLCVPVVVAAGQPLVFRPWTPETELTRGAFGVSVPVSGPAVTPDVLITPLLAFDPRGYRLGYGGGYYDRTLSQLRARHAAVAIGLAYDVQAVDRVPSETTDQPLDAVITEAQVYRTAG